MSEYKILLADAPISRGIGEHNEELWNPEKEREEAEPLGLLSPTLLGFRSGYLSSTRDAKYRATEKGPDGFLPNNPQALSEIAANYETQITSAFLDQVFTSRDDVDRNLQYMIDVANTLRDVGAKYVILSDKNGTVPFLIENAGKRTEIAWSDMKSYASNAEYAAREILKETGIKSLWHNHGAGYIELDKEYREFLELVDPDVLGACPDTGHMMLGGGDPVKFYVDFADRIPYIHLKDFDLSVLERSKNYFDAVNNGLYPLLGDGIVPFDELLAEILRLQTVEIAVVEQDILDPTQIWDAHQKAVRNRRFLIEQGWPV